MLYADCFVLNKIINVQNAVPTKLVLCQLLRKGRLVHFLKKFMNYFKNLNVFSKLSFFKDRIFAATKE